MNTNTLKVLVDTNVWVDYYTGRDVDHGHSSKLIKKLLCSKHSVLASSLSTKDLFYLLQAYLKTAHRSYSGGSFNHIQAAAIQEVAWKSTEHLIGAVDIVPVDDIGCRRALSLRETCIDYEDNLVVACAESCGADYLVTCDNALRAPKPLSVVSPKQLYAMLFEN